MSDAIAVKDLRKTFGNQRVLNGIDLNISEGNTFVLLGRSGTGKSVLLKLLVGLQKPDGGSIRVHDQEITDLPIEQLNQARRKIGFLFQEGALYDSLSLGQNVAFPLRQQRDISEKDKLDRARELLGQVGMEKDFDKMPSEISGGMKKRAGLARALALNPDILLFDEPTAGLDPITANEINQLILKLHGERHATAVVVTHDLRGAQTISDRVALIHQGDILIEGSYDDLKKSKEEFVAQFFSEGGGS
jgi:phospholipid/cholesterol/gamma-HCH transport system ATP-binding protein